MYAHSRDFVDVAAAVPDIDRLLDEVVGLRRLLGDAVDGVLQDLAPSANP